MTVIRNYQHMVFNSDTPVLLNLFCYYHDLRIPANVISVRESWLIWTGLAESSVSQNCQQICYEHTLVSSLWPKHVSPPPTYNTYSTIVSWDTNFLPAWPIPPPIIEKQHANNKMLAIELGLLIRLEREHTMGEVTPEMPHFVFICLLAFFRIGWQV